MKKNISFYSFSLSQYSNSIKSYVKKYFLDLPRLKDWIFEAEIRGYNQGKKEGKLAGKIAEEQRIFTKIINQQFGSISGLINDFNYLKFLKDIIPVDIINQKSNNDHKITNRYIDSIKLVKPDNKVIFQKGTIQFPDSHSLWTLINEILINEDYYFETNTDAPRILDCGTHCGLAIYYFKNLYPKAKIIGFEPMPTMQKIASKNIADNQYSEVEILPYALSNVAGKTKFLVSRNFSMGGSLTERRRDAGDDVYEIEVECKLLSSYIKEPVNFLKLDIEGSEDLVLEEAKNFLENVQHIFCEYHHGNGLNTDRLGKILLLLNNAGFDTQVSKAFSFQKRSSKRPMNFVEHPYSAIIWAKNKHWKF